MARERFEDALHRLEKVVSKLEEGDLPLEESLKYFEEGIRLSRFCNQKLEEAEKRVEILIKDKDGAEKIEPFSLSVPPGRDSGQISQPLQVMDPECIPATTSNRAKTIDQEASLFGRPEVTGARLLEEKE